MPILTLFLQTAINASPQMSGGDLSGLAATLKQTLYPIIALGFGFAGLAVMYALVTGNDRSKKYVIQYIIALLTFIAIWQLT